MVEMRDLEQEGISFSISNLPSTYIHKIHTE